MNDGEKGPDITPDASDWSPHDRGGAAVETRERAPGADPSLEYRKGVEARWLNGPFPEFESPDSLNMELELPREFVALAWRISSVTGFSTVEVIGRALSVYTFVLDAQRQGKRVGIISDPDVVLDVEFTEPG